MNAGVVHIVDDDDATKDSLRFLLASAGIPVRCHDSGSSFLGELESAEAGCLISDIRMPDISGIELLRIVREKRPSIPVVLITGHGDVTLAVDAMKLGAADFLEKPYSEDAILAAVGAALEKQTDAGRTEAERADIAERLEQLSPREAQVLAGVVAGKPNKIIAYDLDISPRTVEVYRANLMTKMRASSLSHLVRMALQAGLEDQTRRA